MLRVNINIIIARPKYKMYSSVIQNSILHNVIKVCFYIAQYSVHWTTQSSVLSTVSLGSILAMQQLRATTKSLTLQLVSIASYSLLV